MTNIKLIVNFKRTKRQSTIPSKTIIPSIKPSQTLNPHSPVEKLAHQNVESDGKQFDTVSGVDSIPTDNISNEQGIANDIDEMIDAWNKSEFASISAEDFTKSLSHMNFFDDEDEVVNTNETKSFPELQNIRSLIKQFEHFSLSEEINHPIEIQNTIKPPPANPEYIYIIRNNTDIKVYAHNEDAQKHLTCVTGEAFQKFQYNDKEAIANFLNEPYPSPHVYAVKKGWSTGLYANKADALLQTTGFENAEWKSFALSDAINIQRYMGELYRQTALQKLRQEYETTKAQQAQKKHKAELSINDTSVIKPKATPTPPTKYVYAVKVGRHPGVYAELKAANEEVTGFKGAQLKKFPESDIAGIKEYLGFAPVMPGEKVTVKTKITPLTIKEYPEEAHDKICVAYTDGSYSDVTCKAGAGAVLFFEGKRYEISQPYPDKELGIQFRNIVAEMFAVMLALYTASIHGAEKVIVYHDLETLSHIANDIQPTNHTFAKEYRNMILRYRNMMQVEFRRSPAHTGVKFHNEADKLAKDATK